MRALTITIMLMLLSGCATKPEYPAPPVSGDEIVITASSLAEMTPRFYSYSKDGKRYDFFVISINGEVSSYVDACFECGPKKKGFVKDGRRLRCKYCGESFPLESLTGIGSCYPIPLEGEEIGDRYIISIEQLIRKTKYPL